MKRLITVNMLLLIAFIALWNIGGDTSAEYNRFKAVGEDKIRGGYDITVIEDTETGCQYMYVSASTGIVIEPIIAKPGKIGCVE